MVQEGCWLSPLWQMMTLRDRKVKYLAQETAGWIMESTIEQDSPSPESVCLPTEVNLTCFCLSPCNTCPDIMSLFRLGGYLSTPRPCESIWKVSSKWVFVLLAQTRHDKWIACFKEMSTCPLGIIVWPAGLAPGKLLSAFQNLDDHGRL